MSFLAGIGRTFRPGQQVGAAVASVRTRVGLMLLKPWLKQQYLEQHQVWEHAHDQMDTHANYERFHWGVLMGVRRLYDGKAPASSLPEFKATLQRNKLSMVKQPTD